MWGRFSYAGQRDLCGNLVKFERFSLLIHRGDLTRLEVTGEVLKGLDQDTDGEVNDVKGGVVRVNEQSDERKEVI